MTQALDPRAKELFLQVLELPEEERAAFLARLERESPALQRQVRDLLAAHATAGASELERMHAALQAGLRRPARGAGQRLGDYELIEEIGSGAFGSVWRARQVPLDRVVALKLLRAGNLAGSRDMERLRAEAEAIARLDHAHIVPVLEVGEHEGQAFFSMKWLEGGTLADRHGQPWPPRRAVRLVADVARAVHHAHQRGLLHRDLKPSNVLLDSAGRPHVADFGIAKRLDGSGAAVTTQALAGTPAYMAPEQTEGGELTVATDVWALGCILYELLAGRPPFQAASVTETLRRIRESEPTAPRELCPGLPRDLETIVLVCLRKEAERRYASADALADDLERWLAHLPIAARRTSALERVGLFCRRSPLAASLIGLAAGLLLLLAVGATWASLELGARLRESYLGEARATRLSGVAGSRSKGLELLARAAEIRPGDDLRDEAIACLALADLRLEKAVARPDGTRRILSVDGDLERVALESDEGLRILAFDGGEELARLREQDFVHARWSRAGRWLASKHGERADAARGNRFHLWDVATGEARLSREEAIASRAFAFAPDESRFAYANSSGELVLLELPSGAERLRLPLGAPPRSLAFDPDGRRLALVFGEELEGELRLLDAATGQLERARPLSAPAFDVCWTGDGSRIAVAGADFRIVTFTPDTLEPRAECVGHAGEVFELFAAPGSTLLLSNSWDETARLWDASTGEEIRRKSARALGFAGDGERLALSDASSWSRWRVERGDFLRTVDAHAGKSPRELCFSPDGQLVASGGPDGVFLWTLDPGRRPEPLLATDARGLSFVQRGRALAITGPDGLLRFDLDTRAEPERLLAGPLWSLAAAREGALLAAQGAAAVHLVELAEPSRVRTLRGRPGLEYVTISADGSWVAAGNWHGAGVLLWDTRADGEPRCFLPEESNVFAALAPDGTLLATATNARFELWSCASGERVFALERRWEYGNVPPPIAFSADGQRVAYGHATEVVLLLDTRTFETLGNLEAAQPEPVVGIAFSPAGERLATACSTNQLQLWDLAGLERELVSRGLARPR